MNSDSIELRSARIVPRPTVEDDLDWVLAAEQVPQNAVGITPWSRNDHRDVVRSPDGSHWMLEASGDHRILGYLIFRGLTSPERSIELKRIVISEKRRGYGREGLQLAKQLAFERFRAHRLWLGRLHRQRGCLAALRVGRLHTRGHPAGVLASTASATARS